MSDPDPIPTLIPHPPPDLPAPTETFQTIGTRPAFGTPQPIITIGLTPHPLSIPTILSTVKDPGAGAVVFFAGTTRNTFDSLPVSHLSYTAYPPLTMRTLADIATRIVEKHKLVAIAIVHRLGTVPVGEESVVVAVAAAHRGEAWRAGEECLERVKERAEIWKREEFVGGEGVWRENREGGGQGEGNGEGGEEGV